MNRSKTHQDRISASIELLEEIDIDTMLIEVDFRFIEGILPEELLDPDDPVYGFDFPGAYLITTESGRQYAGGSERVAERIRPQFKKGYWGEQINNVDLYITDCVENVIILEYNMIKELKPYWNFHWPYSGRLKGHQRKLNVI